MRAVQITDSVAHHGEGAFWHDGWGGLKWVDMLRGDILSLRADGAVDRMPVGSPVAAMLRPRAGGGFVVATEAGFSLWDEGREQWRSPDLWLRGEARFNEGGVTPEGDLLCGTITADRSEGSASVWRIGADRSAVPLFGGVTISNGLGFTRAGDRMYYVDSRTRRIDVIDWEDARPGERRPFVSLEEGVGGPDGLCVDSEDGVWVALYGGSAVRRYDASGRLTDVVEVGATKVTSCALGGDDLRTLFITTSREHLEADEQPEAGALFAAQVAVAGVVGQLVQF